MVAPQFTSMNLQAAPVAKTGYTTPNHHKKEKPATSMVAESKTCYIPLDCSKIKKRAYMLDEVVGVSSTWGLTLQKWDGK